MKNKNSNKKRAAAENLRDSEPEIKIADNALEDALNFRFESPQSLSSIIDEFFSKLLLSKPGFRDSIEDLRFIVNEYLDNDLSGQEEIAVRSNNSFRDYSANDEDDDDYLADFNTYTPIVKLIGNVCNG